MPLERKIIEGKEYTCWVDGNGEIISIFGDPMKDKADAYAKALDEATRRNSNKKDDIKIELVKDEDVKVTPVLNEKEIDINDEDYYSWENIEKRAKANSHRKLLAKRCERRRAKTQGMIAGIVLAMFAGSIITLFLCCALGAFK